MILKLLFSSENKGSNIAEVKKYFSDVVEFKNN